jgi:FimV-like protein
MTTFAERRQILASAVVLAALHISNAAVAEEVPAAPVQEDPVAVVEPAVEPQASEPQPTDVAAPVVAEPATDAAAAEPTLPSEYGPTKKGEALMAIAKRLELNGTVTADQLGWAIYSNNKSAFEKEDITRLRVGQTLAIPPLDEVQATASNTARDEIEKLLKVSRNRPAPKPQDPVVAKLRSELAETKRDSEENAKEQALLKRRLQEIEKEIQQLLRANAERDVALRKQASAAK